MQMRRIAAVVVALTVTACSGGSRDTATASGKIAVATSFSTLNSFVEAVGGDRVTVQNLVPVGASPEDYEPTPQDVAMVSRAQLFVENGAGIETWLHRVTDNVHNPQMRTLTLSAGLPVHGNNPHLWMDPVFAKRYTDKVRDELIAMDPSYAKQYRANAAAYDKRLDELQSWISKQVANIPPDKRSMIIFHNAFDYYNRRFGIRTVGVVELSPGQDPNPAYIAHLVELAKAHDVRAVFAEPEYSPKLAQALAKSAGIRTVSNLYDDSIGNDPRLNEYTKMLRYDTTVITEALK
jgi:manganese/iron transport system substrate-binding protein